MIRSGPAPWRQPVIGGARTAPFWRCRPGKGALSEERRVLAPLSVLLGHQETVGDDQGTVAASLPVTDWLEHDGGSLPEGVLTVLCDTVLGSAVHVTLAPGESMATTWLSMSSSPMPRPTGRLHARSQLVQRLGDTAVSRAEVLDDGGHLAAVASCRVLITSTPVGDGPTTVPQPQVQPRIAPGSSSPGADAPLGVKRNQDGLGRLLALEATDGRSGPPDRVPRPAADGGDVRHGPVLDAGDRMADVVGRNRPGRCRRVAGTCHQPRRRVLHPRRRRGLQHHRLQCRLRPTGRRVGGPASGGGHRGAARSPGGRGGLHRLRRGEPARPDDHRIVVHLSRIGHPWVRLLRCGRRQGGAGPADGIGPSRSATSTR